MAKGGAVLEVLRNRLPSPFTLPCLETSLPSFRLAGLENPMVFAAQTKQGAKEGAKQCVEGGSGLSSFRAQEFPEPGTALGPKGV